MEIPKYTSQVEPMGRKALKNELDLQQISDYYHICHTAAKKWYSHPKFPADLHQFLAERQTWIACFGVSDEFPGKDPLYDLFVAALDDHRKESETCVQNEAEKSQTNQIDTFQRKIEQLEAMLQQKDLVIQNKDDLNKVKDETLEAHKTLISEKDRIFRVKEDEYFETAKIHQRTEKELEQSLFKAQTLEHRICYLESEAKADGRRLSSLKGISARRDKAIAVKENELRRLQSRMEEQSTGLMTQLAQKDRDIDALLCEIDRLRVKTPAEKDPMMVGEGSVIKLEFPISGDGNVDFDCGGSEEGEVTMRIKEEPID